MLAKIRSVKLPNTCQKPSCSVIYFDSKKYMPIPKFNSIIFISVCLLAEHPTMALRT